MSVFACAVFNESVFDTDCVEEVDIRPVQTTDFRQPVYSHVFERPTPVIREAESEGGLEWFGHSSITFPRRQRVYARSSPVEYDATGSSHAYPQRVGESRSVASGVLGGSAKVAWGWTPAPTPVECGFAASTKAKGLTMAQQVIADTQVMQMLQVLGALGAFKDP